MPFWRKKDQGFEWNKYVRTTVLVRRKKRRQKIEEAGAAAAFGVRQAKWKSIEQAKAAADAVGRGSVVAGHAVRSGSKASWAYSWPRIKHLARTTAQRLTQGFWASLEMITAAARASWHGSCRFVSHVLWPGMQSFGQTLSRVAAPLIGRIAKPEVMGPLALVAVIAGVSAVANYSSSGFSSETLFITGLALSLIGLLVVAWPPGTTLRGTGASLSMPKLPQWRSLPRHSARAGVAAMVALLGAGGIYAISSGAGTLGWPDLPKLDLFTASSPTATSPKTSGATASRSKKSDSKTSGSETSGFNLSALNPFKSEVISGRARAIDGGHVRVRKQRLRLDNIDALLPSQTCTSRRGRAWRCGRQAKIQLARLVRRQTLTCTVSGTDDDGVKRATCVSKNGDVSAALVAKGYAFAHLGMFASYRDEEDEAQQKKRGIWQGPAKRPADFRIAKWDKAAETAPKGCPIKGRVIRRKRLYALPWDRGYARVKIRPRRGEKWFCTEQEARAAGFQRAS